MAKDWSQTGRRPVVKYLASAGKTMSIVYDLVLEREQLWQSVNPKRRSCGINI